MADNPFESLTATPKGRARSQADPFSSLTGGTAARRESSDPFASLSGGKPTLEQEVEKSGASTFLDTAMQAGGAVVDLLSRPNYAVAGAVQEALGGTPENIPGRVGRELLSGIGPIQGSKKGFGQVLEESGIGTGGQLSDVVPFLYSDTGEGLALERGGMLDPTARGAVGLGLDIATDPLTYLGGAGAVKIGGRSLTRKGEGLLAKEAAELAGKPTKELARDMLSAINRAKEEASLLGKKFDQEAFVRAELPGIARLHAEERLAKSPVEGLFKDQTVIGKAKAKVADTVRDRLGDTRVGKAFDSAMNLVRPGWSIRDLEGAHEMRTLAKAKVVAQTARANEMMAALRKKFGLNEAEMKAVTKAMDEGTIADLSPKLQEAATELRGVGDRILALDQAAGVFNVEPVPNYIAHYYDNTAAEWNDAISRYGKKPLGLEGDLGRHLEQRGFPTLKKAEEFGLKPIYDPFEATRRRMVASIRARNFRDYEMNLARKFGPDSVRFNIDEIYDTMARTSAQLPESEARAVEKALALERGKKVAAVQALTDKGKRAFFEERVARIKSPQELTSVLNKYKEFKEYFPKALKPNPDVYAPNGERWSSITLKGMGEVTLPKSLAEDVASFDKNLLNFDTPEGKGLKSFLNTWDWINNTFKLGVTAFPAFHVRNFYNNVAQSFAEMGMSIFNPEVRQGAFRMLAGRDGEFVTKYGTYKLSDLKRIFEDRGIIIPGNSLLEYTGKQNGKTAIRRGIEKYQAKIGGTIENEGRIAHALGMLKRGHSLEDTVRSVNKTLVNYSDLTNAERVFFRRAFPFWTWTSRNAAFQLDTIMHRPGLLANQVKPFRGRETENQQMTSWEAGALKLRLDGDGKTVRMITGVDLPIRNLDLIWRGNLAKTAMGVIGMMAPPAKAGLETAFNKSAFTGKEWDRGQSVVIGNLLAHTPKPMQQWFGLKKETDKAGRPQYTFDQQRAYLFFQSWMASRLISTSDRQFRQWADDPSLTPILIDTLTGLRLKDVNFSDEKAKVAREREAYLQRALQRAGERRSFTKVY